jgi:hypothetical protein
MRLQTDMQITGVALTSNAINLTIKNTGNEIITDFPHTNIFLYTVGTTTGYQIFIYNLTDATHQDLQTPGSWTKSILNDYVHPGELDPGETMYVNAYPATAPPTQFDIRICTNNGVYASRIV